MSNHSVSFPAAAPGESKPLRGGGKEAWRLWLDAYLDDITLAKLNAILKAELPLKVTVETDVKVENKA